MRKLAYFCGAFSGGIFLAQFLLPGDILLPLAAAALGLALVLRLLPGHIGRGALLIGTGMALAFGYQWLYTDQLHSVEALAGQEYVPLCATVWDYPEETTYGSRLVVRLEGVRHGKVMLYAGREGLDAVPGQTIEVPVRFQGASRIQENDVTTFVSRGIFLLAYQQGELTLRDGTTDDLRWRLAHLRHAVQEKIRAVFSEEAAPVILALLTGERSELPLQVESDFTEAGILHMLAVSGLHCGLLLGMVVWIVRSRWHWMTAATAIPLLVFYVFFTGASPSVVRAGIMTGFFLLAYVFHREPDGITSLLAALAFLLTVNPFSACSVSLQLSFASMSGIVLVTPGLYGLLTKKYDGRLWRALSGSLCATLGALIFTLPLSVYYFGSMVLISPVSNFLSLWAVGLTFPFAFFSVLAGFVCPPLAGIVAIVPEVLVRYLLAVAHACASVPYHAIYRANPYLKFTLPLLYILLAVVWRMKGKGAKTYVLAGSAAALMLVCTIVLGTARDENALDVVVLDVGQGQCVLLSCGDMTALVDCGSGNSWINAGTLAANLLSSMGCRELDYLVLTHYDRDHNSGVEELLCRVPANRLLLPEDSVGRAEEISAAAPGAEIYLVKNWEQFGLGEGTLTVYPPLGEEGDNERGLSVLATLGSNDLLVTGDMESATEEKLLSSFTMPDIEVLIAGHHGAKYSTSPRLLETLKPEIACISVGSNAYGHPAAETLQRLADFGCEVYRTDLQGNIHFSLKRETRDGIQQKDF